MDIFDQIGKKVSSVSSKAIQKTKDLTDCSSMKVSIANEEKQLKVLYSELGQKYYQLHKDDCMDAELNKIIDVIKESQQRVDNYEKQIKDIQEVRRCVNCGAPIRDGFDFCTSCGTRINTSPTVFMPDDDKPGGVKHCTHCGAALEEDVLFCTSCGHPVEQDEVIEKETPLSGGAMVEDSTSNRSDQVNNESEEELICCANCGAVLRPGIRFCTSCGTPIEEPEKNVVEEETSVTNSSSPKDNPNPEVESEKEKEEESACCANCGAVLRPGVRFCTSCGTPIELPRQESEDRIVEESQDVTVQLDECQEDEEQDSERSASDSSFEELPEREEPLTESTSSLDEVSESEQETEQRCTSCGAVLRPGVNFCTSCGSPIKK